MINLTLKQLYAVLFFDWDSIPCRPRSVPVVCPDRARVITAELASQIMAMENYQEIFHLYCTNMPLGWYVVWCRAAWNESNEKYFQLRDNDDADRYKQLEKTDNKNRILQMAHKLHTTRPTIKMADIVATMELQYSVGEPALELFVREIETRLHVPNLYIPPAV